MLIGHGCLRCSCSNLLFPGPLGLGGSRRIHGNYSGIAYSVVRDSSSRAKCKKIINTFRYIMWFFSFGSLPPSWARCLERNDQWAIYFKLVETTCRNSLNYATVCLVLQQCLHLAFRLCLMPLVHVPTWFAVHSYLIELSASAISKF